MTPDEADSFALKLDSLTVTSVGKFWSFIGAYYGYRLALDAGEIRARQPIMQRIVAKVQQVA